VFGVPVSAPVVVLKLIPGGVALIVYLANGPPVELAVNPVAAVFTVLLSDEEVIVNAGGVTSDLITRLTPVELTATNAPLLTLWSITVPYVTDSQLFVLFSAAVCALQVSPLLMLVITVPALPTATKIPSPYVTAFQLEFMPVVREVHPIPSSLVITAPLAPTATNKGLGFSPTVPYVTAFQLEFMPVV
jgi:hypothetical protein